jgi:hypothetical protein
MSTITPEMSTMNHYVALVADATGRYAHVYGKYMTWHEFCNELEEAGCEVVEDQSYEYITDNKVVFSELAADAVCTLQELIDAPGFTPFA